ncbi:MAG: VCBS repeat-containing protein [Bacteroidetes bacterium]|nr:VCBS repeat-containing protein [Bacteroidota bacterium]
MKSIKVFLVLLALHFQSQAQICFSDNPINYGVSTGIPFLNGVATGNFSTDSLPDVAIAYTNNIRIKVRNGNSGFLNGPLLTIGANNVYEMKAADMDNDGFEDIVVLSIYCKLHIFYNNGNGTFADSIYASGSLFGTGKMFVEDMDNDGFKEVMMIAGNSTVFLNDGLRNFTPQSIPMPYTPDAACIGQWNNDVFPDILVTDNGILHPLLGSGSGLFSQSTGVSFPSNILTMTLADMNNDLFTDVISGTSFDLTVHYRDASGSISQTSQIITNTSVSEFLYPDYFLVSDLEQDFFPELIFSSQWNSNVAVINNVNGTLTMRQYACTGGADHLTLEDMNLDGLPDIVTSSSGPDGYFSLMMGEIGSTFDANEYINSGHGLTSDFETLVAGDLNGDGFKDLVTYGYDTVLVYINNGSGGFASPTKFTVGPTGNNNSPILIADFNADGNLDVIVANAMQQFFLFRGQGNGNFLSPVIILAPDYTFFEAMVVGNFNNDTLPDIAYGVSAAIKILLNSGNGTFSQGSTLGATSYIMGLDVGDFNEDGYDDIVCTNNFTAGNLYLNNGSGVFTASSGFVSCINGSLSAVACGDLNHDGHMDVAFTDYDCGFPDRVIIYHGDGTGALTAGGSVSVYESPYHLAITDINLDGYNDIITNSMSGFLNR